MPSRSMVQLQCRKAKEKFWMKRGFTQTRLGDEVMYQAASGYLHMSVTLRKLKEALSVNSAPQVSPSPSPNPSPSPSPSPSPDPSPSPSPSPNPQEDIVHLKLGDSTSCETR